MAWYSDLLGTVKSTFRISKVTLSTTSVTPRTVSLPDSSGVAEISSNSVISSSGTTLISGVTYFFNTSGGAISATLPATPAASDSIRIVDSAGTFATNNLTLLRNGQTVEGATTDLICDVNKVEFRVVFNGSTWKVV